MQILVIEDDPRVLAYIGRGLREAGHTVDAIGDGRDGLYAAAARDYDVIVLDRMLPGVEGTTILQTMRAAGNMTPVLILSALGEVDQRVEGLRLGADDYLAKPFSIAELVARVEVLGRRPAAGREPGRIAIDGLELDLVARRVRRDGKRIELTPREFRILEYLVRNRGRVIPRTLLLEAVWDYRFDPQTNVVDQHVSRLRQKIDRPSGPSLIETVRGVGYVVRGEEPE